MIKVKVKPSSIVIKGHADYDDYGRDIVCSSVSSITTTTVNAIMIFHELAIKYKVKEGLVTIDVIENDETTRKLLDNMINLLTELSESYPKNIKVERNDI